MSVNEWIPFWEPHRQGFIFWNMNRKSGFAKRCWGFWILFLFPHMALNIISRLLIWASFWNKGSEIGKKTEIQISLAYFGNKVLMRNCAKFGCFLATCSRDQFRRRNEQHSSRNRQLSVKKISAEHQCKQATSTRLLPTSGQFLTQFSPVDLFQTEL